VASVGGSDPVCVCSYRHAAASMQHQPPAPHILRPVQGGRTHGGCCTRAHEFPATALCVVWLQDKRIMDYIASYFNRTITEIEWDDEDRFLTVLKESM